MSTWVHDHEHSLRAQAWCCLVRAFQDDGLDYLLYAGGMK